MPDRLDGVPIRAASRTSVQGVPLPYRFLRLRACARGFAIVLLLSLSACAMQTTSNFDTAAWKSQRGVAAQQNQRGPMLASAEKAVQVGMPRDEVIALLGEPDIRDAAAATDLYELGVARYGIDEEFFEITYQDGKVASHRWGRR
ncbi:MAG: hypothetical protein HOP03_07565 [Lysobacter sp.]|nr:hypothetical protein [Lysobacter sp.]